MKDFIYMNKKKVLVIGSNSFSGASFIQHLLHKNYEVIGCSRSPEKNNCFLPYKWTDHHTFNFFQFDLNKNCSEIIQLIKDFNVDFVVNFAAQSMVGESWDSPEDWFQTNAVAMSQLVAKLARLSIIKKFVHITTPEVYGNCSGFISENSPFNPSTPYASSRVASDLIMKNYYEAFNFPYIATRASNVYGPGQQLYRIIPKTIISILTNQKIPLHGGGLSTRSFIYMSDVNRATEELMVGDIIGETFHISTNEVISIKDLIQKISDKLNVNYKSVIKILPERTGKDSTYELSSKKIRNIYNWSDEISLDEGIDKTIIWVEKNLKYLRNLESVYIHKK